MTDYLRICGPFSVPSGYAAMTRAALRCANLAGFTVQAVEADQFRFGHQGFSDGERRPYRKADYPPKGYRRAFAQVRGTDGLLYDCPDADAEKSSRDPLRDIVHMAQYAEIQAAFLQEIPDDAPTLFIHLPHHMSYEPLYRKGARIGWTMIESDHISEAWANPMRHLDTILTPSEFCRDTFARAGYESTVVPIPVDDRLWTPDGGKEGFPKQPPFTFYSVFGNRARKGWETLITAFTEEFAGESEHVGLLLKPTRGSEVEERAAWSREAGASIWVDHEPRTDWEMGAFYRGCDVYVCPSSEGFGLPFVEAALCGKPSIALDKGGAAEVVSEATGWPVPSEMKTLRGYMPHIYEPEARFATCEIDDLRRVLRAAYEDKQQQAKAAAALARACAEFTPAAVAPRFREAIEAACETRRKPDIMAAWGRIQATAITGKEPFIYPGYKGEFRPQYALTSGAWGDVFVAIGSALALRDPARPLHALYVGPDKAIPDFLRLQPFLDGVQSHLMDKDAFLRFFRLASMSRVTRVEDWLPDLAAHFGIDPADILHSQVNQSEDRPVHRWHNAVLDSDVRAWAHTQERAFTADNGGEGYILLFPYSTQSAKLKEHWPHWEEAIRWLLQTTPHTYVLCGIDDIDVPEHPRLWNLVKKTPSMQHVLALCEKARGVICTCNAIAHWTVLQGIPGLVCANSVFNDEADFYRQWTGVPPNTTLYAYERLEKFMRVAREWLAERFAGVEVEA